MTFPSTVKGMLVRLLGGRPHTVTLYGKSGCHLCEDAEMMLQRLQRRYDFTVEPVDITTDPALFRSYDIRIPVIVVDGQHELDAPIAERTLRKLLR